ncbi:MAG: tetraacyldisaccharide 4'-kinase [Rubrivivax sp.]|jgi:tetraacyldisaccharide 4'-kinase|nr:tetraacyldisaccharide 4'-kinase [Rubrivivax sp.]
MPSAGGLRARLEAVLSRHWWAPRSTALAWTLVPLAAIYAAGAALAALPWRLGWRRAAQAPVPVVVVGNIVVGGAGKTPAVIALVEALRRRGRRPGVVSRGHGRRGDGIVEVRPGDDPAATGDEPLLIRRVSGVPVWVGRRRADAARALCARHPEVDVLVCDDGLQHRGLARDAEVVVFDRRGQGNGRLLPAGPLREPLRAARRDSRFVLYNAEAPSTPIDGWVATRALGDALPIAAWHRGDRSAAMPLASLRGRPILAAAGIGDPGRFFTMLESRGLDVRRLPLPDHHAWSEPAWPPGTADVVVTEKDAVKIPARWGDTTHLWVVRLDFRLPEGLVDAVCQRIAARPSP